MTETDRNTDAISVNTFRLDYGPVSASPPPLAYAPSATTAEPRSATGEFSRGWRAAVVVIAVGISALGSLGFVNSFVRVQIAAMASFHWFAWTLPVGVDLGIALFSALDIVLAKVGMRVWWLRLVAPTLTAATVYLNVSGEPTRFGQIAHGVLPGLWVAAVEVASKVVRRREKLERTASTQMDRIRASRWLLAPVPTMLLFRRMVLWEVRSYREALDREHDRVLALTSLKDTYGPIAWRWRAPRRERVLYRLGELRPKGVALDEAAATGAGVSPPSDLPHSSQGTITNVSELQGPEFRPRFPASRSAGRPSRGRLLRRSRERASANAWPARGQLVGQGPAESPANEGPDPAARERPPTRLSRGQSTADRVARTTARHPEWTAKQVATSLKIGERTARRYMTGR